MSNPHPAADSSSFHLALPLSLNSDGRKERGRTQFVQKDGGTGSLARSGKPILPIYRADVGTGSHSIRSNPSESSIKPEQDFVVVEAVAGLEILNSLDLLSKSDLVDLGMSARRVGKVGRGRRLRVRGYKGADNL